MEKIKENGVFIGVIAFVLFIIVFIFMSSTEPTHDNKGKTAENSASSESVSPKETALAAGTFVGTVAHVDAKGASLAYSFALPEGVKTEVSEDGAYIVATKGDKTFMKMYISDERDRKQDEKAYLTAIIAPQVKGFTLLGAGTIGSYSWQKAESATMEWRVAKVDGGNWLVMAESYKSDSKDIENLLGTLKVEYKANVTATAKADTGTSVKVESVTTK